MKIVERRLVTQEWYETEFSETGWESQGGWRFLDDVDNNPDDFNWNIVQHIETDKFGNPTLAIAEKETKLKL